MDIFKRNEISDLCRRHGIKTIFWKESRGEMTMLLQPLAPPMMEEAIFFPQEITIQEKHCMRSFAWEVALSIERMKRKLRSTRRPRRNESPDDTKLRIMMSENEMSYYKELFNDIKDAKN